jgi:hypothetical protein
MDGQNNQSLVILHESPVTVSTSSPSQQTDSAGGQIVGLSLVAPAGPTNAPVLLAISGLNRMIYVDDFSFGS